MSESFVLLERSAKALGLTFSEKQLEQFMEYQRLLLLWNQRINLTAITDPDEIVTKHFIDSLSFLCHREIKPEESWIDIGTGAGFPGLPLKIMRPQGKAVLLDSLQKRVHFLEEVIVSLSLENISCIHTRAEDAGRDVLYREQMDICFTRAVAKLHILCGYCLPFLKTGGLMVAYKGPRSDPEILEAQENIKKMGGEMEQVFTMELPNSSISHRLIFIRKVRQTTAAYREKPVKKRKSSIK